MQVSRYLKPSLPFTCTWAWQTCWDYIILGKPLPPSTIAPLLSTCLGLGLDLNIWNCHREPSRCYSLLTLKAPLEIYQEGCFSCFVLFHLPLYFFLQESHLESKVPCPVGEDTRSVIQATATPLLNKSNGTDSLLPNHPAAQERVDYITVKLMYTLG